MPQPCFRGLQDRATSVPCAAPAPAPSSSPHQEVYLQRCGGAPRPAPQLRGDSAARILATQGQGSGAGHPSTCGFPKATARRPGKGQPLGSLLLGGHGPSRHKLPWQMGVLRSPPPLEVSAAAGNPATHDELRQRLTSPARGLLRTRALGPSTGMENSVMWRVVLERRLLCQGYLRSWKEGCFFKLQDLAPVPILLSHREYDTK